MATTLGVLLGMNWLTACVGLGVWLVMVGTTRYISVASIVAAGTLPVWMAVAGARWEWAAFWTGMAALVIARHIPNLGRLMEGTESKIGERVDV